MGNKTAWLTGLSERPVCPMHDSCSQYYQFASCCRCLGIPGGQEMGMGSVGCWSAVRKAYATSTDGLGGVCSKKITLIF